MSDLSKQTDLIFNTYSGARLELQMRPCGRNFYLFIFCFLLVRKHQIIQWKEWIQSFEQFPLQCECSQDASRFKYLVQGSLLSQSKDCSLAASLLHKQRYNLIEPSRVPKYPDLILMKTEKGNGKVGERHAEHLWGQSGAMHDLSSPCFCLLFGCSQLRCMLGKLLMKQILNLLPPGVCATTLTFCLCDLLCT